MAKDIDDEFKIIFPGENDAILLVLHTRKIVNILKYDS